MVLEATYVLPVRAEDAPARELSEYLRCIAQRCQLVIVDGSADAVFQRANQAWASFACHIPPDPDLDYRNGKVNGVLTGLRRAQFERVVIADEDVRYDGAALRRVVAELEGADLVRPQNYFDPLPMRARIDTARTLINRACGGDFPGTLAVRRSVVEATGGYDGDVLFENLELIRTVEAVGGVVVSPLDLFVARRPATRRHFIRQRVRQAYEELARPARFVVALAVVPSLVAARRHRRRVLVGWAAVALAVAEAGRRRAGGAQVFPASCTLLAPVWGAERAVCAWLALARRAHGGCAYGDGRLVRAATRPRVLRQCLADQSRWSRPTAAR